MSREVVRSRRGFLLASAAAFGSLIACRRSSRSASSLVVDAASASPPSLDFSRTWLFFVGVLEWQDPEYEQFPKEGRRDEVLLDALVGRGVPEDQTVFLVDTAATKARIEKRFAAHLRRAKPGDVLWLYYAGHGERLKSGETGFVPYDSSDSDPLWTASSVFDAIERNFAGDVALLTADCCSSGGLAEEAARRKGRVAYACLASALARESSTERWTFTDCLIDGVRGEPRIDLDGDGRITFDELARYTESEMAFVEGQLSSTKTTGFFAPATAVASTNGAHDAKLGAQLEVDDGDDWIRAEVIGVDGDRLRVRFVGGEEGSEAWIDRDRTRNWKPEQLAIGSEVEVEWEGKWYPAHVLDAKLGVHFVHYDDDGEEWDEWVAPQRIRRRGEIVALAKEFFAPGLTKRPRAGRRIKRARTAP